MKYQNAKDFLDPALFVQLQKQAGGRLLYIPTIGEKKNWGEVSGERDKLKERNQQIQRDYRNGMGISALSQKWFLSVASIRKILAAGKAVTPHHYLGLDVGGTFIKYGVVEEDGRLLSQDSIDTPKTERSFLEGMYRLVDTVMAKDPYIAGIGVACAGQIQHGNLVTAVNLPLKDTPLRDLLAAHAGVPVELENDANCAALGEYAASAEDTDMLYITLGTGVGAGVILNRQLYTGSHGFAGEAGHMTLVFDGEPCYCGKRGCFERYAATSALVRRVEAAVAAHPQSLLAARAATQPVDGRLPFDAAADGCAVAQELLREHGRYIAAGIDSLCDLFDPQHVVLAGGITKQGDTLLALLQDHLHTNVRVTVAQNSGSSGVIGAARLFSPSGGRKGAVL